MRSLKRTLLMRYAITVVIILAMVVFALVFTVHARLPEAIALMVGLGVLLILLGAVTVWTQKKLISDLDEIGRGLDKIVLDKELDRMPQPHFNELAELAQKIDSIAGTVRENYRLLAQERDRLKTILENTSVGIIVVGRDLRTRMINPVALKLLGTTRDYALGRTFTELHHTPSIDSAIELARQGEDITDEVTINLPRTRTLKVLVSPIRTGEESISGVICILEDVTARRRLERVRSDFVANVSHELRTPVASVRALVEALMAGAAGEPKVAERFIADLDKESRRLVDIIEDLLVLSRLEAGKHDLTDSVPFSVVEVLEEIMVEKAQLAVSSRVSLDLTGDGRTVMMQGNRKLIKTACSNLVDNAIKYNVENGRVEVSTARVNDEVLIGVKDTGIGIPASERNKIFERFYRVDKARSRETGGTGLGLSIVKHAAEYHGGNIRIESRVGSGSTFELVFPAPPPA
jgi:two-component system, OmpR family, phosphate regulon sensor histidine kinase PhoR